MSGYAENTSVSVEKSRAEIERVLSRYGASRIAEAEGAAEAWWSDWLAMVGATMKRDRARKVE